MNADVVVVGAGVIGSSIALELARTGMTVVVVDKNGAPGHGSTSASSAVVRFSYSTFDAVALAWESAHAWLGFAEHLGASATDALARFHRTGVVRLDDQTPRAKYIDLFTAVGVPFEEWDSAELTRRVAGLDAGCFGPPTRPEDDRFWADPPSQVGALFTPDGGHIDDPSLAAENFAAAAARHGATFVMKRAVVAVRRSGDRVAGVTLDDGTQVAARVVVNAAGPWSTQLNALAGVGADFAIKVRPMRAEVHHVPAAPEQAGLETSQRMMIADADLGTYIRSDSAGAVLVGGMEPECDPLEWIDDPDAANLRATGAAFDLQVTRAARRFPNLGVPGRPSGIAGVYDVAEDWTPIYDQTELPGYYVAMGTSGNQFKNAPCAGQVMAAIIVTTENGRPHDDEPVQLTGRHTGNTINLAAFSRRRRVHSGSARSVSG